jgi:type I restriction enzyme S subunit
MSDELPQGWTFTTLGQICSKPQYGWTCKAAKQGQIKYVRTTDISRGRIDWATVPFCEDLPNEVDKYRVHRNDILVSRAGSVGVSLRVEDVPCDAVFASYLIRFNTLDGMEPKFVEAFLKSDDYSRSISEFAAGIAVPNVNASKLASLEMPLAPLGEQRRIVAKLEKLLSKVDTCQQRLTKVPVLLKRFRQAVLAAACSGRLTADWREEHPSNLDGKNLLRSLLSTRRAKWEAKQLEKFRTRGRMPKDGSWKTAYPECRQPSSDGLPPLPADWTWIALACVVTRVKRGPSMKCNQKAQGVRYITSGNLEAGKLRLDLDQKYLTDFDEIEKCRLLPGDLILNCVNSLAKIGKSAVFEAKHGKAIVGFNNYALELSTDFISAYFLNLVCQNDVFLSQLYLVVKHAVNQVSFATEELEKVAVPVPPLAEQQEIVRRVEALFALADQIEARYAKAKAHVEKLTQSILAKAFRGDLVPQDPNDEPASVLLERICADRGKLNISRRLSLILHSTGSRTN